MTEIDAPISRGSWRHETRAMIALALPLILGNLAQSVIYATDLIYLGRVGADALAAGALGLNLYGPFMIFGTGLLTAIAPLIATERGRRAHSVRDVRRTVRQGLWMSLTLSVPCWLALWHTEAILRAMGQDAALSEQAGRFVRLLQWGLLPYFLHLVLRFYISALERPLWIFAILFATVAINALAGWVLIFGHLGLPALGLEGAGIASALSNLALFAGLAAVATRHRHFRRYRLFGRFWKPDWPRYRAIWTLGLPIAVTLTLEMTVFNAAVFLMGLIDRPSLAAHAIAIQIAAFSFMVPLGIAQAATVRVGLGFGAGDTAAVGRAGWLAFAIGTGFMTLMALTLLLIPRPLIGIFLDLADPANAEIVALAVAFLAVAALFQIVDGAQVVGAGALRGLHDTRWPMVYAAVGYWVIGIGVGVVLAFPLGLRGVGIWLGLASGLAVVAALVLWRWAMRGRLGLLTPAAPA